MKSFNVNLCPKKVGQQLSQESSSLQNLDAMLDKVVYRGVMGNPPQIEGALLNSIFSKIKEYPAECSAKQLEKLKQSMDECGTNGGVTKDEEAVVPIQSRLSSPPNG